MGNVDSSEDGSQNFVMTMGEKYSFYKEMNDIRFGDIRKNSLINFICIN